jgi:hypothetical protein
MGNERCAGFKKEAFTSTIDNYVAKLTFQFAQVRYPDRPAIDIIGNWATVSEKLMTNESFGAPFLKTITGSTMK